MKFRRAVSGFQKKSLLESFQRWRWLIIIVSGLLLLWIEAREFLLHEVSGNQTFDYIEVILYAVLLISTGLLIELFARSNHAYRQAAEILAHKHRLSVELMNHDNWQSLAEKLAAVPLQIVEAEETYVLLSDPLTENYQIAAHWTSQSLLTQKVNWDPRIPCAKCLEKNKPSFHICRSKEGGEPFHAYSLVAATPNYPTAVLKFRTRPEAKLSEEEMKIFSSIRDEIVAAIQAGQDRRRLSEMQSAEIAMAERRTVSTFVHDQLGQNLGYIHMKLDQLGTTENPPRGQALRTEFKRLREVANESYEIVRDILKKMQPETVPHLTNLLREHAHTVSRRGKFAINFKAAGQPLRLAPTIQQLIFFTFREILSNVEKHADADKVDVQVTWNDTSLEISVADNGKGFDTAAVNPDEHFGLDIMQERMSSIKGKVEIKSSVAGGTYVLLFVPLEPIKLPAAEAIP